MTVDSSYCLIHGTRSLKWPKVGLSHPTVGSLLQCYEEGNSASECETHHPHYIWVPLVVLLQAGLSYLPHFLWYHWEGGKMRSMLAKLMERPKFFNDDKREKRQTMIHTDTLQLRSSGHRVKLSVELVN